MINKYTRLVLITLLFVFLQKISFAHTTPTDSIEQIDKFYSDIKVNTDGTITVIENIQYNFGQNTKHGIFRNIPFKKTNADGKRFNMDINVDSVMDDAGNEYAYEVSTNSDQISIKIGDANQHVAGVKNYIIIYTVSGALTYFSDHIELYWNVTGNDWDVAIKEPAAIILLPNTITNTDIKATCYVGYVGATLQDCTYIKDDSTDTLIYTAEELSAGEGLTIVTGFPPDWVSVLEPTPDRSWLKNLAITILLTGAGIYWYLLLPIFIFTKRLGIRQYFKDNQKVVAAWFDPPKDTYGKSYTPAETGILIDKTPDHKEITGTIIHLAQRGYLKIVEQDKIVSFIKLKEYVNDHELKDFEKLLLDGLFEKGDTASTKNLSKSVAFGGVISKFLTAVESNLEKQNLFDTDFSNAKNAHTALLAFSGITINIPLLLVLFAFRNHYIKFNDIGIQKFSETASLYNFLVSQSEQLDFQAKNQMFFEKLLPYATAFGAEKIWAQKFKDLEFAKADWYDGNLGNYLAFSSLSNKIGSSVKSSQSYTTSRSSSGFSSGFSGGSSGGGGGGGGGGSW